MSALARFIGSTVAAAVLAPSVGLPAHAQVTVTLGATAAARGETILVQVTATPPGRARYCTYHLAGRQRQLLATRKVRHGRSSFRLHTEDLKPGKYRAAVYCGRVGHGRSASFTVNAPRPQPQPTPTQTPAPEPAPTTPPVPAPPVPPMPQAATCRAVEGGGSYRPSRGFATAGWRLSNASSTHDATSIDVTARFWSGDTVIASENRVLGLIPAGRSLLVGFDYIPVDSDVTRISISTSCDSEPAGSVRSVISGSATAAPTDLDDIEVQGRFTNTYPFTLSGLAEVDYVTRDAAGEITGGGFQFLGDPVPRATSRTWQIPNPAFPPTSLPDSIDFTVEPYFS